MKIATKCFGIGLLDGQTKVISFQMTMHTSKFERNCQARNRKSTNNVKHHTTFGGTLHESITL